MFKQSVEEVDLKHLLMTICLTLSVLFSSAHAAEVNATNPPQSAYNRHSLILVSNGQMNYQVFGQKGPLSAIQFSRILSSQLPRFIGMEQQLRRQQAANVVGGVLVGTLGAAGFLLCGVASGAVLMSGIPSLAALFVAGMAASGAIIYGGFVLAKMKIPVFKVWGPNEAKKLIQNYNRQLLDEYVHKPKTLVQLSLVLRGDGIGFIGKF